MLLSLKIVIGVENNAGGGFEHDMFGSHAVKLNGRTYHMLLNASSSDPSCGVSYFVFDSINAVTNAANSRDIDMESVKVIYNYLLDKNPIANYLKSIGTDITNNELVLRDYGTNVIARLNQQASYLEIASITNSSSSGNKIVRFQLKDKPDTTNIQMTNELLEPLCYPLLFNQ